MVSPVILTTNNLLAPASGVEAPVPAARLDAFEQAMARQVAEPEVTLVAQAGATPPVTPPASAVEIGAENRARQGLGLDGAPAVAPSNAGDMILDGMQQLRGVFDAREARISQLMSTESVNANMMMAMQMEVASFTLLVDMSSKLTGKVTQSVDTLMKGQ